MAITVNVNEFLNAFWLILALLATLKETEMLYIVSKTDFYFFLIFLSHLGGVEMSGPRY